MDKVFVLTNISSWRNISEEIRDRVKWNPYPNENNPVLQCVPGIYLVYDSIDDNRLNQLFNESQNDHLYILIHTHGHQYEKFDQWKDRCSIKRGKHENNREDLYFPVFEIIADSDGDKVGRIIKAVFMTYEEAVAELLNECLSPKKNLDDSNAYITVCQKDEVKKALEDFKKVYESRDSFDGYQEDLEQLRKLLVGHFSSNHSS
ncbi:MAG: hypothetical protein K5920_06620 [Bacteroidales bacterium]|nr:hypothetical protein [Bacteroidales bacterium]